MVHVFSGIRTLIQLFSRSLLQVAAALNFWLTRTLPLRNPFLPPTPFRTNSEILRHINFISDLVLQLIQPPTKYCNF